MTASNSDYMQRADDAAALLEQARQMILPGGTRSPLAIGWMLPPRLSKSFR
jgi:hypothetical protein